MVDISAKRPTRRKAVAEGKIFLDAALLKRIKEGRIPKGDVLKTAEIAALFAFKNTPFVIPHCHPVHPTRGRVSFTLEKTGIRVRTEVVGLDRTGYEMEALNGAAAALLTIYDMCKFSGYTMEMGEIRLLRKTGGKKRWKR